jgi:Holliday junction resolvase YEN1
VDAYGNRLYNEIGAGTRIALSRLAIEKFEQAGRPFRLAIDASIWQFQTQSGKGALASRVPHIF